MLRKLFSLLSIEPRQRERCYYCIQQNARFVSDAEQSPNTCLRISIHQVHTHGRKQHPIQDQIETSFDIVKGYCEIHFPPENVFAPGHVEL